MNLRVGTTSKVVGGIGLVAMSFQSNHLKKVVFVGINPHRILMSTTGSLIIIHTHRRIFSLVGFEGNRFYCWTYVLIFVRERKWKLSGEALFVKVFHKGIRTMTHKPCLVATLL